MGFYWSMLGGSFVGFLVFCFWFSSLLGCFLLMFSLSLGVLLMLCFLCFLAVCVFALLPCFLGCC